MSQQLPPKSVFRKHGDSPSASQPLTSSEKRKATIRANREAQRLQDEALAQTLPPRQAKVTAKKNSVWINNDATRKKRCAVDNSTEVQPSHKRARRTQDTITQHTVEYDDNSDAVVSTNTPPVAAPPTVQSVLTAVGTKKRGSRKMSRGREDLRKSLSISEIGARLNPPKMRDNKAIRETDPIEDFSGGDDDDDDDCDRDRDHRGGDNYDDDCDEDEDDRDRDRNDDDDGYNSDRDENTRLRDNADKSDSVSEGDFESRDESDYPMEKKLTWKTADVKSDSMGSDDEDESYSEDKRSKAIAPDAPAGSDDELEYAQKHGVGNLSKKHRDVDTLFDDNADVTNGRAPLPHQAPRCKKPSRQARRLTKESPKWVYPKPGPLPIVKGRKAQRSGSHTTQDSETVSGADDEGVRNFGARARVAWTKRGNIAISRSSDEMQGCFHEVDNRCKLHLIRRDAFPETTMPSEKRDVIKHHWLRVSEERKVWDEGRQIPSRLKYDSKFSNGLYDAMSTRMSLFRGRFKTAACKKLSECLGLGAHTPKDDEWAASLLITKHYIFPVKAKRTSDLSKPFENPIIAEVMKEVLASHRQCWIVEYIGRFKVKSGATYTYEMPKPVVALAAAAVEAALRDYCNRSSQPSEFSAEVYGSVYRAHLTVLERQELKKNPQHHKLMAKLYSDTFETENPARDVATANILWSDIEWDEVESH